MRFLLALVPLVLGRQDPGRTAFRIESQLVQVDVLVERGGRAVTGLTAADFDVYDDAELQKVELRDVTTVPLHVVLALDTSASMAGAKLRHLQSAARGFLAQLGTDDHAALISFSHHVSLGEASTREHDRLSLALDSLEAFGATAWHDGLFAALKVVEGVSGRPLVLLFTDGEDTYSWLADEHLLRVVEESSALVYAVARGELPDMNARTRSEREARRRARSEHARRTRLLRELTEASGGRLIETASTDRLRESFLEILGESRTRYLLTFVPKAPIREGWHELKVKVKRRGVEVHARRGYFYEAR